MPPQDLISDGAEMNRHLFLSGWGFRPDDQLRLADKGVSCLGASSSSAYKAIDFRAVFFP